VLRFALELPASTNEAYLCYGFDASVLDGQVVRGVQWTPPAGGTTLHHAKLWATSETRPTGNAPFPCDPMPADALGVHLWVPGGSPFELPPDVGLELPDGVRTLVVEAHAVRIDDTPSDTGSVMVMRSTHRPLKIAAWLGLEAPVPAIRPHMREESTSRCRLSNEFHALYSLPHMHRIGRKFHATRVLDSEATLIVDVDPWDFALQRTYETPIDFATEDSIEITCTWENPDDSYVLPGIYTKDEMCTFGLIGWPREGVACVYE
jgi:hypothetical protein